MSQITIAIVMLGEREEGGGFSLLLHSTAKYCTDWDRIGCLFWETAFFSPSRDLLDSNLVGWDGMRMGRNSMNTKYSQGEKEITVSN
jgi:hypothetical protein